MLSKTIRMGTPALNFATMHTSVPAPRNIGSQIRRPCHSKLLRSDAAHQFNNVQVHLKSHSMPDTPRDNVSREADQARLKLEVSLYWTVPESKIMQYNNEDAPSVGMNRRADIIVSGWVQGVGFRYMVRGAARQCLLKGEVENMEDDTVRITCEGKERNIVKFVEAVRMAKKPIEVDNVQIEYSEPTGRFKNFRIIMGDYLTELVEGFRTYNAYLRLMVDNMDKHL